MLALALHLQLTVPGDFATIQAAVDAAEPNETILVRGGIHEPVTITRSVTLIGYDRPWIREDPEAFVVHQRPGLYLDGPGYGTVAVSGFLLHSENSTTWLSTAAPGITGQGFDALILDDCQVYGGGYGYFGPDSAIWGESGIDVGGDGVYPWSHGAGVTNLFLTDCYVQAQDCGGGDAFWAFQAHAGVRGVNVYTERTRIRGSASGPYSWGQCVSQGAAGPSGPDVECVYGEFVDSYIYGGRAVEHTYAGQRCAVSRAGRPVEMLERPRATR